MEMTSLGHLTSSVQVCPLELSIFPSTCPEHVGRQVGFQFDSLRRVVHSLSNLVGLLGALLDKLALLESINHFLVVGVKFGVLRESLELSLIFVIECLCNSLHILLLVSAKLDPLVGHGLLEANLGDLSSYSLLNIGLGCLLVEDQGIGILELWGSVCQVTLSFFGQADLP